MPETTHARRCTTELTSLVFCDRESIPGAPFPICYKHAGALFAFLRDAIDAEDLFAAHKKTMSVIEQVPQYADGIDVVYYLKAGIHIKIGWTGDLRHRMYHYQPGVELIAVEPGSRQLEAQRHEQFAHLRLGQREWFMPGPDLRAHLAEIVEQHGVPA